MLPLLVLVAVLAALGYYIFSGGEPERSGVPQRRTGNPRPEAPADGPDVHQKKVRKDAREAYQTALERAQEAGADMEELAKESYVLAESLGEMFASDQFFERRVRFDSFRTALRAAEDARDTLLDRQEKKLQRAHVSVPSATGCVGDQYARRATESALMIAWCAGGLLGKSRLESARAAFRVSVSAEDVRSWDRFGQVLRKESEHHRIDAPGG
ncbi:hypothetical protein [Salinibacter altiplanensis]|uniref:hypothetical protein n=1 Tax=Salinibacter altiplanensis TaxID=1803181 RepID=UPI000C9ED973|nr:hypothetical protein [Salinibacter altiplanensis]